MAGAEIATQWTTPTTPAGRPWIMWCDWVDLIGYIELPSITITDNGGNTPTTLQFTATDRTNTVGGLLAKQMRVMFVDTQANNNNGQILFHGFVKFIRPKLVATYARYDVICSDISEFLDYSYPIETFPRPAESDGTRIAAILGRYSTWSSMPCGGFIQSLSSLTAGDPGKGTVRNAIEGVLGQTGLGAGYYVDGLGYLHTFTAPGDGGAAPYAISDAPNYTTTIPAAIEIEFDGSQDTDAVWISGGTSRGSGPVNGSNAPRFPYRIRPIDDPASVDAATKAGAGAAALQLAQNATRITVTVTADQQHGNFGGWASGQVLSVTNSVMAWTARQFAILGVSTIFKNGKGHRQYKLVCGLVPLQPRSIVRTLTKIASTQTKPGSAIAGRIGSASV